MMKPKKSIRFPTTHGIVEAYDGDSVSLTFGMSRKSLPHSPIMHGVSETITTMCDHDIGVVVDEDSGLSKYNDIVSKRVKEGGIPIGYDPYNKADVNDVCPSITASYGIVGRIGTTLIFEVNEDGKGNDYPCGKPE